MHRCPYHSPARCFFRHYMCRRMCRRMWWWCSMHRSMRRSTVAVHRPTLSLFPSLPLPPSLPPSLSLPLSPSLTRLLLLLSP